MITKETMKTQVGRLMRLPYVPREPDDIKGLAEEYKRVLSERCRDDLHAVRAVDAVMDTPREQLLTPGDIVHAAAGTAVDSPQQGFAGCELCEFTGWQQRCRDGYEYSVPCSGCRPPASKPPEKPSLFELDRRKAKPAFDGRAAGAGERT